MPRKVDVRAFPSEMVLLLLLLATMVLLNAFSTALWLAGLDYGGATPFRVLTNLQIVLIPGIAGWALLAWWRVRRSVPLADTPFTEAATAVDRLVRQARLPRSPDVRMGPRLGRRAFVAAGTGRPLVLLGPEVLSLCTARPPVFDAVVRHELAHLRAGDLGWYQLATVLRASIPPTAFFVLFAYWWGSWRVAVAATVCAVVQAAIAELVARAFLRAREHNADLHASRHGTEGLLAAVGTGTAVRPWLRRHPGGAERTAALTDPGRLLTTAPAQLLLGAMAAGAALVTLQYLALSDDSLSPTAKTVVTGVLVGVPLTLFTAFAIWRSVWGDGERRLLSAAALAAGLVLGSHLALYTRSFGLGLNGIPLTPLMLAAVAVTCLALCLWLSGVARAWHRTDPSARKVGRFLAYAVPSAILVGGWAFAVLWSWSARLRACPDVPACRLNDPATVVARSVAADFAFGYWSVFVVLVIAATLLGPRLLDRTPAVVAAVSALAVLGGLSLLGTPTPKPRVPLEVRAVVETVSDFDCLTRAPDLACGPGGRDQYRLGPVDLTEADVESAKPVLGLGKWSVEVTLTSAGTDRWTDLTRRAVGKQVALVVDGVVVSAPTVQEPLTGSTFQISLPQGTRTEAEDLAAKLSGG